MQNWDPVAHKRAVADEGYLGLADVLVQFEEPDGSHFAQWAGPPNYTQAHSPRRCAAIVTNVSSEARMEAVVRQVVHGFGCGWVVALPGLHGSYTARSVPPWWRQEVAAVAAAKLDDEQLQRHGAWAVFWGETTPLLWREKLTRMETRYPQPCAPGNHSGEGGYAHLRVRDVVSQRVLVDPIPQSEGTTYGSGFVSSSGYFHAFGSNWCMHNCGGVNPASGPHACRWGSGGTQVLGFRSNDPELQRWEPAKVALEMPASGQAQGCRMFNTDVHRAGKPHSYIMSIEVMCSNATGAWAGLASFHNIFAVHPGGADLTTGWTLLDPGQFVLPMHSGPQYLTNCPSIRYHEPWYYNIFASWDYDSAGRQTSWRLSSWVARSKDLRTWEKSAAPLVAPNAAGDKQLAAGYLPSAAEAGGLKAVNDSNASDLDWVELPNGTVYLEWAMGCQSPGDVANCDPAMYAVSATTAGTGGEAAWLAAAFKDPLSLGRAAAKLDDGTVGASKASHRRRFSAEEFERLRQEIHTLPRDEAERRFAEVEPLHAPPPRQNKIDHFVRTSAPGSIGALTDTALQVVLFMENRGEHSASPYLAFSQA